MAGKALYEFIPNYDGFQVCYAPHEGQERIGTFYFCKTIQQAHTKIAVLLRAGFKAFQIQLVDQYQILSWSVEF